MKFRFTLLITLLLSAFTAWAQSGQTVDLSFTHEGDLRTYQLYIPPSYDGSEDWPLVLNLHGFGANTGIQVFTSQMNEIADAEGFLIAYPQGLNTMLPDGSEGTGWNADWWTGRDDAGALSKLIDHAWTNHAVDLNRVYATGLDNGGQMSLALACALNDRIAAVGGVAVPFTQPQLDNCTPDRPVPALLMHGTADVLTSFDGVPGFIPSAPDLAAAWAAQNNCDTEPAETMLPDINTEDSSSVILRVFENCDEGATVRFYEITGGGHTWSDGPPVPPGFEILGNVNRDVSSSVEMWDFFAQFTHPNPREGTVIEEGNVGLLQKTVTIDGVERRYNLYVPVDYDGSEAWPLVINMHGFAGTSNDQLTVSDMNPVADTAHFLIAYPQGLNRESLGDTGFGWNFENDSNQADDLGFFNALIDQVYNEYGINLARVYATGLSQGGAMSYRLGRDLSDRIAAIAPVAASGSSAFEFVPDRPLPFLQIHGTADGLALYEGREEIATISVEATLDTYVVNNSCSTEAVTTELPDVNTMDNSTVTRIEYPGCAAGTEVVHYRVNNGGHTWPGGPSQPVFFGPTNQDFHASSTIWNFFNRHVHPDPRPVAQLLDLTLAYQDSTRKYLLYVPADYDGSEAWPLVVNMHGQGVNRYGQVLESQMNPVADTAHFLVVYPEATMAPFVTGGLAPVWNAAMDPNRPDDVGFVNQLIEELAQDWNIDLSRVYATGKSAGGVMSYTLACTYPERIAAIASVSGLTALSSDWTCTAGRPLPVLHIHGSADVISPINGGAGILGPDLIFPPVRDQLQAWLDSNNCSADSTVIMLPDMNTEDGSTVELRKFQSCDTYTGADGEGRVAELWYYRIEGGGHTWPGGPAEQIPPGFEQFFGNINRDINASSEIWNFFNRHVRSRTVSVVAVAPETFQMQVFPNPFFTQLTFTFELPEAARVQLSIFNQLGQEVQTLADQRMAKGAHRIDWNTTARQLPAGMYYYRLRVGDRFVSQPVVLGRMD